MKRIIGFTSPDIPDNNLQKDKLPSQKMGEVRNDSEIEMPKAAQIKGFGGKFTAEDEERLASLRLELIEQRKDKALEQAVNKFEDSLAKIRDEDPRSFHLYKLIFSSTKKSPSFLLKLMKTILKNLKSQPGTPMSSITPGEEFELALEKSISNEIPPEVKIGYL